MNIIESQFRSLYDIALVYDAIENSVFNDRNLFNEMERSKAFCTMVKLKLRAGDIRQQSGGLYIYQGFQAHLHHRDGFISRTEPLQDCIETSDVQNTLINRRIENDVSALMVTTPDWFTVAATPLETLNYMKDVNTESGTNVFNHYIKLCEQIQQLHSEYIIDYALMMLSAIKNNNSFDGDWVEKITEQGIKAGEYKIHFISSQSANRVIFIDERTTLGPKTANEFSLIHNIKRNTVNVRDGEVKSYSRNGAALKDTEFKYQDSEYLYSNVISFSKDIELKKLVPDESHHLNQVSNKLFKIGKPIAPAKMVEHKVTITTSSLKSLIINGYNELSMDYIKMLRGQNTNPIYNEPLHKLLSSFETMGDLFDPLPIIKEMVKQGYLLDTEIGMFDSMDNHGDINPTLLEYGESHRKIVNSDLYACYKNYLLAATLEDAIECLSDTNAHVHPVDLLNDHFIQLSL